MAASNRVFLLSFCLLSLFMRISLTSAFPSHKSVAGFSERNLDELVRRLPQVTPPKPPGPLKYNGTKLVNDAAHPWKPPRKGDIRGPCPALNTLASHGYLPRDGVATPTQLIRAVQEGFNLENTIARLSAYSAHLVDGNLLTDLISIGGKTKKTGQEPPPPAIAGGLNTHSLFEGDTSMTRGDYFFGDNHSFNQTLFDQFVDFSDRFGGGFYNFTVAAELRRHRIQQSIATNPKFTFTSPRFFSAYDESTLPFIFFVDGRITDRATARLDMANATLFFRDSRFPHDFWRAPQPSVGRGNEVHAVHPIKPGRNVDGVNTYRPDPNSASYDNSPCLFYTHFANKMVKGLYPSPKGVLKRNLIINLGFFYDAFRALADCPEQFPYGKLPV